MKLEVGMYVREDGNIGKICDIEEVRNSLIIYQASFNKVIDFVSSETIEKASHNIIDLIEVGDYVNGDLVLSISEFKDGSRYIEFDEGRYLCKNYQIKSIVTKEQFERMAYKVGE